MNASEIVGAIIDLNQVTTDLCTIDAAVAHGRAVNYISRADASRFASYGNANPSVWQLLLDSPTLFVIDNGVRFYPTGSEFWQ